MAKGVVYCAKCGMKIPIYRKVIPSNKRIIEIIQPHECGEVQEIDVEAPLDLPPAVIGMKIEEDEENKFVRKLNKLPMPQGGDKREKKFLREEVRTSSAPAGLQSLDNLTPSIPAGGTESMDADMDDEGEAE